jgi:HK97 family phage major capsid protein
MMANSSLAIARKLKDSSGQPVAGMVGGGLNAAVSGAPTAGNNVVLGYPCYVDPNVAAMSANSKSILFGDFSRVYGRIVNGVRFERSSDFAFSSDLVSFRCLIRLDQKVVDASAIKYMANSAT